MAEKKVTIMVLKVDLQCEKCYKKVKKVLCKFPQIRDQKYDEKANTVTITVVCCSPEKIRDKICRKGCGVIKSIEILPPPKPPVKPADPPKEKPKETAKPDPPKETPKPDPPKETPKPDPPKVTPKPDPPKETPKPDPPKDTPKPDPPKDTPKPDPPKPPPPADGYPSIFPLFGICLVPYCEGYGGGSGCHHGHDRPTPYDGCGCGRDGSRWPSSSGPGYSDGCRCGCGSGGGRGQSSSGFGYSDWCGCGCGGREGYATRSDQYCDEENPQTCRIM